MIVHTRKMPLFDRHGKPTLLLAICEDITARKRSDEALREAQRRLEFTLQGADVGLWDWDLKTNEVIFSEEWKSQLGYHGDEVGNTNSRVGISRSSGRPAAGHGQHSTTQSSGGLPSIARSFACGTRTAPGGGSFLAAP